MSDFDNFGNHDPFHDEPLQRLLHARLVSELTSPIAQSQSIYQATIAKWQLPVIEPVATSAKNERDYLNDIFLNFDAPELRERDVDTILAFSFGNRRGPTTGSMPAPGPVNEEIADATLKLYKRVFQKNPTIYAQWEVAQILATKHRFPASTLVSVSPPTVSATGVITEPTLSAVVAAVTKLATPAQLGNVAVVTHRDQLKSAVENVLAAGVTGGVVDPGSLPVTYDSKASAPVNRQRYLFLLNDMVNQFALLRADLIAKEYPNG